MIQILNAFIKEISHFADQEGELLKFSKCTSL